MSNLVRKATLLSAGALLLAGIANAGVPNNAQSSQPVGILAVGYANPPDPRGLFTYTIRDGAGVAVGAGINVVFDFSSCTDFTICAAQSTGGTVVGNQLTAVTNGLGQVSVNVVGNGNGTGPARVTNACVTVTAGGQPFDSKIVATLDRSNGGGIGVADVTNWITDFVALGYQARSDWDLNGAEGVSDISGVFLPEFVFVTGPNTCPTP